MIVPEGPSAYFFLQSGVHLNVNNSKSAPLKFRNPPTAGLSLETFELQSCMGIFKQLRKNYSLE